MSGVAIRSEDDAASIQRMLDDGAPVYRSVNARRRKSRWSPINPPDEAPTEEHAAQRQPAPRVFRVYCVACGRSSEMSIVPAQPGRCVHCDGTMLVELAAY